MVFVDGILQREGSGNNYVSSGSTISFTSAPDSSAEIDVYTLVKEKVSIDTVADGSITVTKLAAGHPTWNGAGETVIASASTGNSLRITNTGSGNSLLVEDSASTDASPFVITAGGDVGIGTASPAYKLDVNGSLSLGNDGTFYIRNSAGTAQRFVTQGGGVWYITPDQDNAISIGGSNTTGVIAGGIAVAARSKFGATVGVGGTAPSSSGAGITFPATQSASSDANTLDDYEEGTWTPNQGTGLTVVGTFASSGIYTKIGNLVTVNFRVGGGTSVACSSTGEITSNLPFAIANTPGNAMGSCMNSSNANTGAYGYTTTVTIGTTALPTAGAIFVTITYQV